MDARAGDARHHVISTAPCIRQEWVMSPSQASVSGVDPRRRSWTEPPPRLPPLLHLTYDTEYSTLHVHKVLDRPIFHTANNMSRRYRVSSVTCSNTSCVLRRHDNVGRKEGALQHPHYICDPSVSPLEELIDTRRRKTASTCHWPLTCAQSRLDTSIAGIDQSACATPTLPSAFSSNTMVYPTPHTPLHTSYYLTDDHLSSFGF